MIFNYFKNSINYLINFAQNYFSNNEIINSFSEEESLSQFSPEIKVLEIEYSEKNKKLMNIFRYILNTKEISLRVFNLTTEIINISPWTYEIWVVRRKCLSDLKELNINNEIDFVNFIIISYPKIYQIWHHRRLLIDKLNDCSHEKNIIQKILDEDSKNFHCWSHRIWMIRRFNNIEGEFEFIEKMLENDIKNNSVWNYRFFLVEYINGKNMNKNIIKNEIKYAFNKMIICPLNESPFNYILGYINKYKLKYIEIKNEIKVIKIKCDEEKEDINKYIFFLRILLEYYEEDKNISKFNDTIEKLIKIDFIRKKYYLWKKKNFNHS